MIQRRYIGNENFNRKYYEYQRGFGNPQGDYWAGLDAISALTMTGNKYDICFDNITNDFKLNEN